MADTYLSRTPSSASNRKTFTWSGWIKRGSVSSSGYLFTAKQDANNRFDFGWYTSGILLNFVQSSTQLYVRPLALFRDPSAWYHLLFSIDTTNATASDRFKIYVNGVRVTDFVGGSEFENNFSQNDDTVVNTTNPHAIGANPDASTAFDGYMSEVHFTDGTAYAASTFGGTNSDGVWTPKVGPTVTYGTNGFYLKFANSGAMGTDSSGQSNTFALGGGTLRQVPDSPTNVFATLNPLTSSAEAGFSDGNLRFFANTTQTYPYGLSTLGFSSGKWYCEMLREANAVTGGVGIFGTNLTGFGDPTTLYLYYNTGNKYDGTTNSSYGASWGVGDVIGIAYDGSSGNLVFYKNGVSQGTAFTIPTSTVYTFGCQSYTGSTQIDVANFGQDGTFAGNKTAGGNSDANSLGNFLYTVPTGHLALCTDNLSSALTIPINKGADNFTPLIYTGNSATPASGGQAITGVGFAPDWTWIKNRNDSNGHMLYDTVRGAGADKSLTTNNTAAEPSNGENHFPSFGSDGFTVAHADSGSTNNNGESYISWNWKAGSTTPANTYAVKVVSDSGNKYRFDDYGTSAITLELQEGGIFTFDQSDSSNAGHPLRFSSTADGTHGGGSEYTTGVTTTGTPGQAGAKTVITVAGSAPTLYYYCSVHSGMGGQANTGSLFGFTNVKGTIQSVVSPNITAGFSILTFTGTGSNVSVGHGLNQAPEILIVKSRASSANWNLYTSAIDGSLDYLFLNNTDAAGNASNSLPTSSVIYQNNTDSSVAYCFHSVEGYSKIGKYTGNGNADGAFVYTGFRPAYVYAKWTSGANHHVLYDKAMNPSNPASTYQRANDTATDGLNTPIDFLSNGFKIRTTDTALNGNGGSYLYMAFAENPFVSSGGTPVTAR